MTQASLSAVIRMDFWGPRRMAPAHEVGTSSRGSSAGKGGPENCPTYVLSPFAKMCNEDEEVEMKSSSKKHAQLLPCGETLLLPKFPTRVAHFRAGISRQSRPYWATLAVAISRKPDLLRKELLS